MAGSLSPPAIAIAIRLASPVRRSRTRPSTPGFTPALRISSPSSRHSLSRPSFTIRLLAPRASRAFPRPLAALPAHSVPSATSPPSTPQAPREWRKLWAQLARKWDMRGRRWRWGVLDGYLARSMARPFAVAAGVAASVGVALGSLAEVARVAANTGAPLRLALLVALHHLPRFLALALPPACLAASLFAFSHLLVRPVPPLAPTSAPFPCIYPCTTPRPLPLQRRPQAQHHHDPLALLLAHLHPSSPHTAIASPLAGSAGGAVAAAGKGGEGGGGGAGLWRVWYAGEVGGAAMRRVMLLHLAPQGHVHAVVAAERCEWQAHSRTWRLLNCCLLPLATHTCLPPTTHTMAPPSPQPPAEPLSTAPASHSPTAAAASLCVLQLESLDVPLASALPSSSPLASHAALPPASLPRRLLTARSRHLRAQLAWLQRQAPQKGPRWGSKDERAVAEQRRRVGEQRRRVAEAESALLLRDASCASCVAYAVLGAVAVMVTAAPASKRFSGMGGQHAGSRGAPFQLALPLAAAFHLLSTALAAAGRSALLPPLLAAYLPLLLVLLLPPLLLGSQGGNEEAEAGVRVKERGAEGIGDEEEAL
ncbi:unnamed protein product [Closterium sp. Yama58-4]|nr:unnamed protein product [Closterium sp. Yama58-4]